MKNLFEVGKIIHDIWNNEYVLLGRRLFIVCIILVGIILVWTIKWTLGLVFLIALIIYTSGVYKFGKKKAFDALMGK